jgi:hypothetical protein
MKKWNCNIVKEMYDRVLRRKFGMLCSDDTSNENFIKSYLNRLDCKSIDLSCLKGSNLPCTSSEATSIIVCNTSVIINVTTKLVGEETHYTFTAVTTGTTAPISYSWNWNNILVWNYVSGPLLPNTYYLNGNVLVLKPKQLTGTVSSVVSVSIKDANGCESNIGIDVLYKGGCTDPEAVNYDPTATFNNGSCYYEPLTLVTGYTCNEFNDGNFCATISGGVPPYSLIGSPSDTILVDGGSYCEIILNGNSWSCYALDSVGNVTPIQSGTISCPFNCITVKIEPNVIIDCLVDGLGNATGQASITASPYGGTAPYTITISVNGAPAIPFINGSIYNNGDNIKITVTDANGCVGNYEQKIPCPPAIPGGSFNNCSELVEYLNGNDSVSIQVTILDSGLNVGGGYYVDYQVKWITTIPSPLTSANFPTVAATIFNNSTTNLSLQTGISPFSGSGNPFPYIGNVVVNNEVNIKAEYSTAIICGGLLRELVPPSSPNLNLTVDLDFTVVLPNRLICHLCGTGLFSLDYDPCADPFIPSDQTVLITLTLCP